MYLAEFRTSCPYCGEPLVLLLDESDQGAEYTEDCQVCCRPMIVSALALGDCEMMATVRREDE